MQRALSLLLAACFLAGCAETPSSAPDADTAETLGWHIMHESGSMNASAFVLRANGSADRLTYLDDRAPTVRIAPGVSYDADELERIFGVRALDGRAPGGLLLRVERGHVPEPQRAALVAALAGTLPEPPSLPIDFPAHLYRGEDFARLRDGRVEVAHVLEVDGPAPPLGQAFRNAREAFVVATREDAALWRLFPATFDGCLRTSTAADKGAIRPGEAVTLTATVHNCGARDATLSQTPCGAAPTAVMQVQGMMSIGGSLRATEEPGASYALDLVCEDAPALMLAAGENVTLTRRWNGTLAACDVRGPCVFEAPRAGRYSVATFASGAMETNHLEVMVLSEDLPEVPFLLVREYDWVNATRAPSGSLIGDFGGHCAPVLYTEDPPTLTMMFMEPPTEGLVLRDFRDGPRPENVSTLSADRIDAELVENGTATLASPFAPNDVVANVTLDGDAWLVDGVRLGVGERHTMRVERELSGYRIESIMVFENVGRAAVLEERGYGCA